MIRKTILNKLILPGIILLTCSSCASLLNSPTNRLTIYTDTPASAVINKDTLPSVNNQIPLKVLRQETPLAVTLFNNSLSKKIQIEPINSFAYWSNIGFMYGLGMFADMNNPRRYSYPSTVYVSMKNKSPYYYTIDSANIRNKFFVKLSPLKLIDFSNQGLEVSCERRTSNYFSTQVMASVLSPNNFWNLKNNATQDIRGFKLGIEEKYYFNKSAPIGPYLSLELNYLKKRDYSTTFHETLDSTNSNIHPGHIDTTGFNKKTFSINLKIGYQYFIKRFSFDCYAGFGARYKDVHYFYDTETNFFSEFFGFEDREGKYWRIIVPVSFRIGWVF